MNKIYLSALAGKPLIKYLNRNGYETVFITGTSGLSAGSPVYNEALTHADIYMCQLGLWENSRIFMGNTAELKSHYPGNIIYNALCTGKYFIHNFKYTSPALSEAVSSYAHSDGIINVSVSQGYTRCCCLPVNENSFITSDAGISKALESAGADVLLIKPGHIFLPGFEYGFIGGCGGNIITDNRRTVIINGNLKAHPDYEKIADFIKARDINLVFFEEYALEDIGSILVGRKYLR